MDGLIVESLDKDRKASGRNVVRNFNKDLLSEHVKFYLIYYYFLIAGNIKTFLYYFLYILYKKKTA